MKKFTPLYEQDWTSQQVIHYLRRWKYYDTHLNDLDDTEMKFLKALYYRLSYLSDEQREWLAEKYYTDDFLNIPDDQRLADQHGLSLLRYRTKKQTIIAELRQKRDVPAKQFNKLDKLKEMFPEMFN